MKVMVVVMMLIPSLANAMNDGSILSHCLGNNLIITLLAVYAQELRIHIQLDIR